MTPTQIFAFTAQMLLTCSVSLLTHASMEDGKYAYNTLTVPLFAELTKLILSGSLFLKDYHDAGGKMALDVGVGTVMAAAVPALMYFISNNLNFIIIKELGPTNFQLLNNLKILATAVFFRLIMKVKLNDLQWRMLIILTVGCTVSQLTGCVAEGSSGLAGSTLGYALKLCNACLTALGSVFCEKFLKGNSNPFHFQNCLLYLWGSLFTTFSVLVEGKLIVGGMQQLIRGHSVLSFALIANYAFVG
jgi:drug/metabolite transporter (DMT)-like permease